MNALTFVYLAQKLGLKRLAGHGFVFFHFRTIAIPGRARTQNTIACGREPGSSRASRRDHHARAVGVAWVRAIRNACRIAVRSVGFRKIVTLNLAGALRPAEGFGFDEAVAACAAPVALRQRVQCNT